MNLQRPTNGICLSMGRSSKELLMEFDFHASSPKMHSNNGIPFENMGFWGISWNSREQCIQFMEIAAYFD
jgi:hypothetical protein